MVIRYSDLYRETRKALLAQEDPGTAGMMARNLLARFMGCTQEEFLRDSDREADPSVREEVRQAVNRLLMGEPFAYVLGEWDFYGLRLLVTPDVLIPRDDTCAVVSLAIRQAIFLPEQPRILDLCTGSGCIGLAVASRVVDAKVTLADISNEALSVAKKNILAHRLSGRVHSVQIDALAPAPAFLGKFDMIISNPPYVTGAEMEELPNEVKDYEPHLALFGGQDGLDFYRSIAEYFSPALKPGGFLCLEFGMGQGDDVCEILTEHGYTILERTRDYNDRERAVLAQYGGKG